MSNCLNFDTPAVHFKPSEMDMLALRNLLESIPSDWTQATVPHYPYASEEQARQVMAWWFLKGCVDWHPDGCVIRFGRGNSSHTWRDFKGLLQVLQPMIRRPKTKVLVCRDESDGFKRPFRAVVDFKAGTVTG